VDAASPGLLIGACLAFAVTSSAYRNPVPITGPGSDRLETFADPSAIDARRVGRAAAGARDGRGRTPDPGACRLPATTGPPAAAERVG